VPFGNGQESEVKKTSAKRPYLVNKNIAMRDRFKYFNAIVTPVACFGAAQKKGVQTRFVQDGYCVSPVASLHSG